MAQVDPIQNAMLTTARSFSRLARPGRTGLSRLRPVSAPAQWARSTAARPSALALASASAPPHRGLERRQLSGGPAATTAVTAASVMRDDPTNNVSASVAQHIGRGLLQTAHHPLQILKSLIFAHFAAEFPGTFRALDDLSPVCSVQQTFDDLLIPKDHVSRRPSDTFYVDADTCLRPHTSAHQTELLRAGEEAFLVAGDVYRRDEIDQSHYPAFHQMEGVYLVPEGEDQSGAAVEAHLKASLEGMVRAIFGDVKMRWVDAYFPFTEPSHELEIWFNDEWLEVLGCGVVHRDIMRGCGLEHRQGWAFGLGLERLAMVLFDVPDIRLFWTRDERFLEQFRDGRISTFQPYSKYPECLKDISFWVPETFHENDFYSVVRDCGGDLIEKVKLIDEFQHPKTARKSHCYRIAFRSMDRSLTNAEIDEIQIGIRQASVDKLGVELR